MNFLAELKSLPNPAKYRQGRAIRCIEDLKKALDDGYYLYWIDTEGNDYLRQFDYVGTFGHTKADDAKLHEIAEHIALVSKLHEMHTQIANVRINL